AGCGHRLRAGFHRRARCARRQAGAAVAGLRAAAGADLRGLSESQTPVGESTPLRRVPGRALRRGAGLERGVRWLLALLALLPLSEEEPVYFVIGPRGGWNARFQISFKYRLFDQSAGFGAQQPWLQGFYFGYTQSSLWDLSSESKPFRDTSYRPSFFWRWTRP